MSQDKWIDLHVHTTASDGTMRPAEVVRYAQKLGLAAIAITDHDTVAGLEEAAEASRQTGMEVVPGIEISSEYRGCKVHVLGYYIDAQAQSLQDFINWALTERRERNEKIVGMMQSDGYDISMQKLRQAYPEGVLGRPHIAEYLMKQGVVSSVKEAFDTLLGDTGKYYLPKARLPLAEAAKTILGAGGLPVMAHPLQYGYPEAQLRTIVEVAADLGFVGLEVWYPEHTPKDVEQMRALAAEFGLIPTGGSDFHGARKPQIQLGTGTGSLRVPYLVLEELRAERDKLFLIEEKPEEETLSCQQLCDKLCAAADRLEAARDELNALDERCGDGDHGTTMEKVSQAIRYGVENDWEWHTLGELFGCIASNVMMISGGMGARLWYAFFDGMARSLPNSTGLTDGGLRRVFAAGLSSVTDVTDAQPGGKTMMDALIPAVKAMENVDGAEIMLASAAAAAKAGAKATADMPALYGTARRLGDMAVGMLDPGAQGVALFFAGLSEG